MSTITDIPEFAYVGASKDPGALGFNTQPMPLHDAVPYAAALVLEGRRYARVYRADIDAQERCGSFITSDLLLEMRGT